MDSFFRALSTGINDVCFSKYLKSTDKDDDDEVSLSKDNDDNEDDDGQDDDNEQTESDNDGDDFVLPKVQTPSHFESTDDETYDEITQGDNVEREELDEEETNEEEEVNELYNDVNINLEGKDTEIMDALLANVQTTQVIEDTHVIITAVTLEVQQQSSSVSSGFISNMLNPNPDTGIDSILNLKTESTSLGDVPVTTNFEDRLKALEDDFSEFKKTNLFTEVVSSIPGIVDKYLANQMNEAVKAAVQLQSNRLRSEAQADNEDFINKIDENMKKIIKEQVKIQVKEQTSHAVAANLSEIELKKILIDKMKNKKSIDRPVQQKNLYKALVDAYESDKDILATYGDTTTLKRRRDDEDEDEEPSARSNQGSKRRRAGKEPELTSAQNEKTSKSSGKSKEGSKSHQKSTGKSAQAEEPIYADEDLEDPTHQEFNIGFTKDQPVDETTQHPDCTLARNEDPCESFNENMDTPLDFSAFVNDDKPYTLKEGDYNRLRLQYIEDMLLLLVQGKLTNLNVKEHLALGISLRMFTRSVVLRRRVEDLQLGNKDKKNRLMRIEELHKYSDDTLNDVRSALDDILKRIRMEYLPQTVWRNVDRERAGAMIQAIDRQLRNRRLMRSLEKFVGGRLYSNPMIQPEPEGSTQGYPLESVEVLRFNTTAGNPVKKILLKLTLSDHMSILTDSKEYIKMVMEYMFQDFRYSDTERLSRSDEVLKLKNLKKAVLLKLFKLTYQERGLQNPNALFEGSSAFAEGDLIGVSSHTGRISKETMNVVSTDGNLVSSSLRMLYVPGTANVVTLLDVPLNTLGDIDNLTKVIDLGKLEVWSTLPSKKHTEVMETIWGMWDAFLTENPNATSGYSSYLGKSDVGIGESLTCVEGVAVFFGVPLKTKVDYENFAKGIEKGTYEVWSKLTREQRKAILKTTHDGWNNLVELQKKATMVDKQSGDVSLDDPIVKIVNVNEQPNSYVSAAGGSKLDPIKPKANFCSLSSDNLFEGANISIPRKIVETVSS
ncbi:hypothetical protein Tco_1346095 [Tanacetum coccineum]